MTLLPAWAVDGARVPASQARRVQWNSTSGSTGVVLPGDLRVVPRSPAGSGVAIMPGGGVIESRFAGAPGESYGVYNDALLDVPVPATGSSAGRTEYVGIRIDDPQFAGAVPANPLTAPYNRPVLVSSVPTTYPFLLLARITQPANNATVTAAMITDMRRVANPRTLTVTRPKALVTAGVETLTTTTAGGEWFPNAGGEQQIEIPKWASRMQLRGEWFMVKHPGDAYGQCWIEYGPATSVSNREYRSQEFGWDAPVGTGVTRLNWTAVDDVAVPTALRGTTQTFVLKARNAATNATTKKPVLDQASGVNLEVRFFEVADSSDS